MLKKEYSNLLLPSRDKKSYWHHLRLKRFAYFQDLIEQIENKSTLKIIDLGGVPIYWKNMGLADDPKFIIECHNLIKFTSEFTNIFCYTSDVTELTNIKENQFDIAYSNSVIEHVGSYENQKKMASEIKRVARYFFVQTPNFWFPIEPHVRLPIIHFLSLPLQTLLVLLTKRRSINCYKKIKSARERVQLLSRRELKMLFPDGIIMDEKYFGVAKSFMVHNF